MKALHTDRYFLSLRTWLRTAALCGCLFPAAAAQAQNKPWSGFAIESNIVAGKVFKHTPKFRAPIPDLTTAYDLCFLQQTYGKKEWQQRRKYPLVGFGFTYTVYGIDAIYGRCIGMYPVLQLPIVRGNRMEWTLRAGFGLGYVSKHYERVPGWDTLNNAISSHINNFTTFSTDLRYHINTHWDVQLGANFSHISNAALKQPNLGINTYGAHMGVRYYPVTAQPQRMMRKLQPLSNRWLAQARVSMAFNEMGTTDGPLYPVYIASAYVSRRWRSKNKMFAGIDYSYHRKIEAFLKNNEIFPGEEKAHSWKSAVFAGNEFLFGRVGVLLQAGYYIKDAALSIAPYYEKLGGNFYIIQKEQGPVKEMCISVLLKAHKTEAELAELGIGFGF